MSIVAISSQGKDLDDAVDPRFGRAAYFMVVNTDDMSFEVVDNRESGNMAHGAGIQAAENVANKGAQVVLSGYVGPKAYHVLQMAGVQIGQGVDGMNIREAVQRYLDGKVPMDSSPSRPGMPS